MSKPIYTRFLTAGHVTKTTQPSSTMLVTTEESPIYVVKDVSILTPVNAKFGVVIQIGGLWIPTEGDELVDWLAYQWTKTTTERNGFYYHWVGTQVIPRNSRILANASLGEANIIMSGWILTPTPSHPGTSPILPNTGAH